MKYANFILKLLITLLIISDATMIGHVESWTTGEEFAKHLLNLRYTSFSLNEYFDFLYLTGIKINFGPMLNYFNTSLGKF